MKVLVTCIPQAGHLRPMLPLISALHRRGAEVLVATGEAVRADVEAIGVRFEPAGEGLEAWFGTLAARTRGIPGDGLAPDRITQYFIPRLFCEVAAADMIDGVLAVGERLAPDLVLFDTNAFAGPLAAKVLGAQQVNHLYGPLLAADVTELAADAMAPMWRAFDCDARPHAGLYDGDTVLICPPSMDSAVPPSGALMLRPAELPRRAPEAQSPPLVYFSLGTLWSNAAIVDTVLAGLAELPVRVLATIGATDPHALRRVPDNVDVHSYLPQEQVLPDASLVIHHGGAGTMFGALAHGLPQVALPQAADNFVNADLLVRCGAGVTLLPGEVTAEAVAEVVGQVLAEASFATAAQAVANDIARMPTADEVAAHLLK